MPPKVTHLAEPPKSTITPLAAIALVLVGAALTALVWGLSGSFAVTVDGVSHTVAPGTTVADLVASGYTHARPGQLLSKSGVIVNVTGGDTPTFSRNGRDVADTARVFAGDVVASTQGANVVTRTK